MVAGALVAAAPAPAAELQAAYEHYEPGQGFQIGLKHASTGAMLPLPAGVNTTEDELHPTLSPDGRFLAFTRMRLLPKLNGDIVPPPERTLVSVNLQTGAVQVFGAGGVGPTYTQRDPGTVQLSWAAQPDGTTSTEGTTFAGFSSDGSGASTVLNRMYTQLNDPANVFFMHAAGVRGAFSETIAGQPRTRDLRYWTHAVTDPITGFANLPKARLQVSGPGSNDPSRSLRLLQLDIINATHPVPRVSDEFVALASGGDIKTITFPGETTPSPAPAPITTGSSERMPAWSPDGLGLGFVRDLDGRRQLHVFDLTPGIQTIVNPGVDLGALPPSPQTRAFQNLWGGISLAAIPEAPAVSGGKVRANVLLPTVTRPVAGLKIGIFVVRRTGGTKTVLGVEQPRIKVVGRVPLGTAKTGRNRFNWDMRVNGKRLTAGKYLLTYRLLRGEKVTSVSTSVPFTVRR
jgi:hypothetical protein